MITTLIVFETGSLLEGIVFASQITLIGETKVVSISQLEEITAVKEETIEEQTESEEDVAMKPGTPSPA